MRSWKSGSLLLIKAHELWWRVFQVLELWVVFFLSDFLSHFLLWLMVQGILRTASFEPSYHRYEFWAIELFEMTMKWDLAIEKNSLSSSQPDEEVWEIWGVDPCNKWWVSVGKWADFSDFSHLLRHKKRQKSCLKSRWLSQTSRGCYGNEIPWYMNSSLGPISNNTQINTSAKEKTIWKSFEPVLMFVIFFVMNNF